MNLVLIFEVIARWIVLFCIFSGLLYASNKKLQIIFEFAPIFVCASVAVLVFLCGIMGFLLPSVYLISLLGFICFGYMLKHVLFDNKQGWRYYAQKLSICHMAFALGALCFLAQLLRTNLVHYDNYSHWAVVVKEMLITNAVPSADSVMIEFKNYPLGLASFIYFVCKIVGHSQPAMLFAQGLIIFSCFYAILGIITEKRRVLLYAFLGFGCSILSIFNVAIRINNLLVDFILPILALAIIAVIYRYRCELHKLYLVIYPLIGLLGVVKSTGVIYAAFAIVYLLYILVACRKTSTQKELIHIENRTIYTKTGGTTIFFQTLFVLALSMLPAIVWSLHMKLTFAGVENKFEVDASKLQGVYAGKTPEDVKNIVELYLRTIADITSRPTFGIVLFEVLAIALCIVGICVLKKKWVLPKALFALNLMLIFYYAGILAMYIFSMPLEEAIYLAGFERYACSIVILFGGALVMCATIDLENSFHYRVGNQTNYRAFKTIEHKKVYNGCVVFCGALALLILTSEFNGLSYHIKTYPDTLAAKVRAVVGDCWDNDVDHNRYLVYASDTDGQVTSYYLQYLAKYYLRANQVDGLCYFYEDNMLNLLSQYDKLIIIEPDKNQQALMQKYLGESGEAGIYTLQNIPEP